MGNITIETTSNEDVLLAAYATSVNKTVSELVANQGKQGVIDSALRAYAERAASSGALDNAVAASISKDQNAIWTAVRNDWSNAQAFVSVIAASLAGSTSAAAA
jgi:hypothetical protein